MPPIQPTQQTQGTRQHGQSNQSSQRPTSQINPNYNTQNNQNQMSQVAASQGASHSKSSSQSLQGQNHNHHNHPSNSSHPPIDESGPDRRHAKNRFGWVRRLMQGQNRQAALARPRTDNEYVEYKKFAQDKSASASASMVSDQNERDINARRKNSGGSIPYSIDSDQMTTNSDNISTTPLKSIVSSQSTKSPSILSESQDLNSLNASTAETSITPSTYTGNYVTVQTPQAVPDRDSESIVTLASSSRRRRRRSIDTNCSTAGIPPASIMERLSVQPTAANSTYAVSIRTSQFEPSQSSMYDSTDQTSSVRSDGIEV